MVESAGNSSDKGMHSAQAFLPEELIYVIVLFEAFHLGRRLDETEQIATVLTSLAKRNLGM